MTVLTHSLRSIGYVERNLWLGTNAAASTPLHRFAEIAMDIGSIPPAWWLIAAHEDRRAER